mgnify:CR=1 FL=1
MRCIVYKRPFALRAAAQLGEAADAYGDAGGVVGPPVVADPVKIPTLAEVIYKWRMILKGKDVPR